VKDSPSAAICGSAGSGTITSLLTQLLPENRPSRYASPRRRISVLAKRIMTIAAYINGLTCGVQVM
jgi:hypothetical protein